MALAVSREGSEILIYLAGFWPLDDFLSGVGVGSLVGACIGMSIGVMFYYLLLAQRRRRALGLSLVLLGLLGASMASQATRLLIQADWITAGAPLWDTSGFLSEGSLPGQLLYALVGYEATPTAIEVAAYVGSLVVIALATLAGRAAGRPREASA